MFSFLKFQANTFEDAFLLALFIIVNIVFLALFVFVVKYKKSYLGLRDFLIGSIMQILSIIFLTFLNPIKTSWLKLAIMFLANTALVSSYFVILHSLFKMINRKINKRLAIISFVAIILSYFYATFTNYQEEVFSLVTLILLFSVNIFVLIKGNLIRKTKAEQIMWLQYIVIIVSALFLILMYAFYLVGLNGETFKTIILHNGENYILKSVIILNIANIIALSMTFNHLSLTYQKMEKDIFTELFQEAPFIVMAANTEELKINYINPLFIKETGYNKPEVLGKMTVKDLGFTEEVYNKIIKSFLSKKKLKDEKVKLLSKKGNKIYGSLSTTIFEDENGFHLIINILDVSDLVVSREAYKTMALIDYLTSLPNRRALISNLEEKIKNEKFFTIIMIDLDNFKSINDKYGHDCGDLVLKKVGEKLSFINKEPNIVSRYGGDEFVILLSHNKSESQKIMKEIEELFKSPFKIKSRNIDVNASIGHAYFPEDGEKIDKLLRKADNALYRSKKNNSNNVYKLNKNKD